MKQTKKPTRNQWEFLSKKYKIDTRDIRVVEDTKDHITIQDSKGIITKYNR